MRAEPLGITGCVVRTPGACLSPAVHLLAEVVPGWPVVADVVPGVQTLVAGVPLVEDVPAAQVPRPGPDQLGEVSGAPVAPVVLPRVLPEHLHLAVPATDRGLPVGPSLGVGVPQHGGLVEVLTNSEPAADG